MSQVDILENVIDKAQDYALRDTYIPLSIRESIKINIESADSITESTEKKAGKKKLTRKKKPIRAK
jgi:hypothetical protein